MLNYAGTANYIFPGAPWQTILALVSSSPWTAADENPNSWRLRIHPTREGGEAALLVSPAMLAIDPDNAKKLDMRFELTGEQTKMFYRSTPPPAAIELEQLHHGEWKPTPGMSGSAQLRHLPGGGL